MFMCAAGDSLSSVTQGGVELVSSFGQVAGQTCWGLCMSPHGMSGLRGEAMYNWVLDNTDYKHVELTEFSRMNFDYTVLSKRTCRKGRSPPCPRGHHLLRSGASNAVRARGQLDVRRTHDTCRNAT